MDDTDLEVLSKVSQTYLVYNSLTKKLYSKPGKNIYHIGGYGDQSIERWSLQPDGSFLISESQLRLTSWVYYAEPFIIE